MTRRLIALLLCVLVGLAASRLLAWLVYKAVEVMVWLA